jgi:undecaprenyl pyrophosphate phosphatase UppP
MTDERYTRLNQIWTNIIVAQMTLFVLGLWLDEERVLKASLCVGALCLVVGVVVLNERGNRIQAAKDAATDKVASE